VSLSGRLLRCQLPTQSVSSRYAATFSLISIAMFRGPGTAVGVMATCPLIHPNCFRSRSRYLFYRNMTAMTSFDVLLAIRASCNICNRIRQVAPVCTLGHWVLRVYTQRRLHQFVMVQLLSARRLSIVFARWHHCAPPRDVINL